jgi:ribokinase
MDLVVRPKRIPAVGETILGGDFLMVPGGKGANQAVAAAKLGAEVYFVARLGDDVFAEYSLANFRKEGLNTRHVQKTPGVPSGIALIMVDEKGNNSIVVAPGANRRLSKKDVEAARADIARSGAVVCQLEVPLETVAFAAALADKLSIPFILDSAPACKLRADLLGLVDILKPNETEASILTDVKVQDEASACRACEKLLKGGVRTVILTMGSKGYLLADQEGMEFVPGLKVKAVDSTSAGDAFTGSLAIGLAQGKSVARAARYANYAAALSVTKMGAQPSMPTAKEVDQFIAGRKCKGKRR